MGDLSTGAPLLLRPLGFGEIFDRAITLYIRNIWPFVGIVLVLLIPGAALQFIIGGAQADQIAQIWHVMQHPGQPMPSEFPYAGGVLGAIIVVGFISLLLEPFVFTAVAAGVGRLYRGEPVEFRACYRRALRHWPRVLGVLALELLLLIAWYIAVVIVVVLSVLMVIGLLAVSHVLSVLAGIVGALAGLAAFLLLSPLVATCAFAMYAVIFEEKGVSAALGSGFRRVFNRQEFWRALLVVICAGLIAVAASGIVSGIALVALFFKQIWLEVLLNSIANGLITPFSMLLLAVYYFDVLVRRNELPAAEPWTV